MRGWSILLLLQISRGEEACRSREALSLVSLRAAVRKSAHRQEPMIGNPLCGEGDLPAQKVLCYEGSGTSLLGTGYVFVKVPKHDKDSGDVEITATGAVPFECSKRPFKKEGQAVTVQLDDCVPELVEGLSILYCPSDDTVEVAAAGIDAILSRVPCET
mmetsp:Transcript_43151/g.91690  ORF Transcript_43151/g.91690 Transcript_43151/m.91690 type:complete len:159 (+) Transcript_43151:35-511(+)